SWGAQEWANVNPGSIYHALKQATQEGLLEDHYSSKKRGRVDYRITDAGHEEFLRLLRDAISQPEHRPDMIAAGLAMLPALGRAEAIGLLEERLARLKAECSELAPYLDERSDLEEHGLEHVVELTRFWVETNQAA